LPCMPVRSMNFIRNPSGFPTRGHASGSQK
jgi:hypothetical protein